MEQDEKGRFIPGNSLWRNRQRAGRQLTFQGGDELWEACARYFQWVEENPLIEAKPFSYEGKITMASVPKTRAMTIDGLCLFLGITMRTWLNWRDSEVLGDTVSDVETIIRTQKFEGAAAGMLNPAIIARDLGLAERTELSGKDGGPIQVEDVSPADKVRAKLDAISARFDKNNDL